MPRRVGAALCLALCIAAAPHAAGAQGSAPRTVTGSLLAGTAEHRVDAGDGVERSAGVYVGGELRGTLRPWLELRARAARGTLSGSSDGAADRAVSDGELTAAVSPLHWLTLTAGVRARRYASDLGDQRWLSAAVGTESRIPLLGDAVRGLVRLAVLPAVDVTGQPRPTLALGAGTGLEARRDRLSAAVIYTLERYDFAPALRVRDGATVRRLEQLSSLGVRASVRLGR